MGCGKSSVVGSQYPIIDSNIDPNKSGSPNSKGSNLIKANNINNNEISINLDHFEKGDVKMILLGPSECGKTTLWLHLKMNYLGGFNDEERKEIAHNIKINLITFTKDLVKFIQLKVKNPPKDFKSIQGLKFTEDELTLEIGQKINSIWNSSDIKKEYQTNESTEISDNAPFYFDHAAMIARKEYIPSNDDILRSTKCTTKDSQLQFKINNSIKTNLIDVGSTKSETSRWKDFDDVNCIIYVISLSDFNQFWINGNEKTKRTNESIKLFQDVVNSPSFNHKPIFLILNKTDLFADKLIKYPNKFKETYPDFKGDVKNVNACIEHVKTKYTSTLAVDRDKETAWIEVVPMCALDQQKVHDLFQFIAQNFIKYPNLKRPLVGQMANQSSQNQPKPESEVKKKDDQANNSKAKPVDKPKVPSGEDTPKEPLTNKTNKSNTEAKKPNDKSEAKKQNDKPEAKKPNDKSEAKKQNDKSEAKKQNDKSEAKKQNDKPEAKKPNDKPEAKKPKSKMKRNSTPPPGKPKGNGKSNSSNSSKNNSPRKLAKTDDEITVYEYISEYVTDTNSYSEYEASSY
ncbi:hypothetical protein M9Y10_016053 [Tritrichomonas musculus]|uniref:Uncharacterized protein n=1 Tax=Tritrichomonas musculus TaxID=1915356 RepID=A0ABR2I576_9EUKA